MESFPALNKEFEAEYRGAMVDYLESGGEKALHRAYEMGRDALDRRRTILDVARFHSETLLTLLETIPPEDQKKTIADAFAFFTEFISPFEMTYRGFMDALAALRTEIAERQNAEEALKQSERYYKSLIENALDIVTILDESGTILYSSPSGERVLGYATGEMAGKNVFELVHPDDVDQVLEIFSAGKTLPFSTARSIFRFRHKNGEWLILESIGKNLLYDPFVRGIIVNSRDITERRNLEEIRRKYEFIVNASQESMALLNSRYIFEAVNGACCAALSRSREEIIGRRLETVIPDEPFQSTLTLQIEKCLSGTETKEEAWFDLPGLGRKYLDIVCYPYRDSLSAITHAVVIMRDSTERKNSEDQIREAQRQRAEDIRRYAMLTQQAQEEERRRISRELHDDICQRLTALNLRLNLFEDEIVAKKKISVRRLRTVKKEINSLIDEVRNISHNLRPSALDHFGLPSALHLLCNEYRNLNALHIKFETNVEAHNRFDPDIEIALYRIAQEALSNCAKYANVKEAVLGLNQDNGALVLTVEDQGDGFDFSEYRKKTAVEKHFGLMNMRERIELNGGTFTIESSVGNGAKIMATVPIVEK